MQTTNSGKKRILVADGSTIYLEHISALLQKMGFDVITAESGIEVLKHLSTTKPDLIMLNIALPLIDGMKTLKQVKTNEETSAIPVIMLSLDRKEAHIEQCRNLGCSGFLQKPIRIDKLHDLLQDCIYAPTGIRRKSMRIPYISRISVTYRKRSYKLYSENLSAGGIYVRTENPFPVGSKVYIALPLRNEEFLPLKGTVVYTKSIDGSDLSITPGMAIEFEDLTNDDFTTLEHHVLKSLTADIVQDHEETVIAVGHI